MDDSQRASLIGAPFLLARQSIAARVSPFSRGLSTPPSHPPPPPPQSGTIAPPRQGPPPPATGAAAIARSYRPSLLALAPTFLFTHVTLAWALVPPVYVLLRSTNLSNTLLAGPQGAWFLSRKVPDWIPDTVIDGLVGGAPPNAVASGRQRTEGNLTIEELIERLARRAIRIVWNVGSSAYTGLKGGRGEEDALARAALRELRGGLGMERQEVKDEVKEKASGVKDKLMGYTRKQAQGVASDIQFGQIRDGVAAWVLVKVSTDRDGSPHSQSHCLPALPSTDSLPAPTAALAISHTPGCPWTCQAVPQVREVNGDTIVECYPVEGNRAPTAPPLPTPDVSR